MTVYFTSDSHFYHSNIIKYCNRPFKDVEEMNNKLLQNWNERVTPDDIIYCLGDFGFSAESNKILMRMNGEKHLIRGNHDKQVSSLWNSVSTLKEITVDGQLIVLCHYAMRVWNKSFRGSIQLYGHSHGRLKGNSQQLDVGVDCWDYYPVDLPTIQRRLNTLPKYVSEDYHDQ